MGSLFVRAAASTLAVGLLASACAFGPEDELARVQGMNPGLASCVLEQINGRIDTPRVVSIVDASVEPTPAEEEIVVLAFYNCV